MTIQTYKYLLSLIRSQDGKCSQFMSKNAAHACSPKNAFTSVCAITASVHDVHTHCFSQGSYVLIHSRWFGEFLPLFFLPWWRELLCSSTGRRPCRVLSRTHRDPFSRTPCLFAIIFGARSPVELHECTRPNGFNHSAQIMAAIFPVV